MRTLHVAIALVGLLLAVVSVSPGGQSPTDSQIGWFMGVRAGERSAAEPRTFRLYDEENAWELTFGVTNRGVSTVYVDQAELRRALQLSVVSQGRPVDVEFEWQHAIYRSGAPACITVLPDDTVTIEPSHGVRWTIEARRQSGTPLPAGDYVVEVALAPEHRTFGSSPQEPWRGAPILRSTNLTIRVRPGQTPAERAQREIVIGVEAIEEFDFVRAMEAYERALMEDPSSQPAVWGLALGYLGSGRYRDVVDLFDRRFPRVARHPVLAQAYLAVGDEGAARKTLRAIGVSADRVAADIAAFRDAIKMRGR